MRVETLGHTLTEYIYIYILNKICKESFADKMAYNRIILNKTTKVIYTLEDAKRVVFRGREYIFYG